MMKNIVLFRIKKDRAQELHIDKNLAQDVVLKDCLSSSNPASKSKIEALMKIARNEELINFQENENFYSFNLSCEFKTPRLIASSGAPYVSVNYPLWISKKGDWCITQDAGRKLSSIGIALLSHSVFSDPLAIEAAGTTKSGFQSIIEEVVRPSDGGQIKRVSCQNVLYDKIEFKQMSLGANQLQESQLFKDTINFASRISNLTFTTPPLVASNRGLMLRLNDWGGMTIYTPEVLESEIVEIVESIYSVISHAE